MRQDARENRERILAAADEVFGEHAAAGSTEEVARRAGVGVATVFRHFPTKEALVEAALLRHFERLTARAQDLVVAPEPAEALRILVRMMIETGATKLTLASRLTDHGGLPAGVGEASRELQDLAAQVLRRAQDSGAVRSSVKIGEVYLLVRALAQASATMRTPPEELDRAIDVVLAGLSAGPQP